MRQTRWPKTSIRIETYCTTQNCVEFVCSVEHLNSFTHTGLGETSTTENVDSLVSDFMSTTSGVSLEESDWTTEKLALFLVGELVHLVGDGFEPGLVRFADSDHLTQPRYVSMFEAVSIDE